MSGGFSFPFFTNNSNDNNQSTSFFTTNSNTTNNNTNNNDNNHSGLNTGSNSVFNVGNDPNSTFNTGLNSLFNSTGSFEFPNLFQHFTQQPQEVYTHACPDVHQNNPNIHRSSHPSSSQNNQNSQTYTQQAFQQTQNFQPNNNNTNHSQNNQQTTTNNTTTSARPSFCTKRLTKEKRELANSPAENVSLLEETNEYEWLIKIIGASGTLYQGEEFILRFRFPDRYPLDSPEVVFVGNSPVHPHIYSNGHICLSILYDGWSPALGVSAVCLSLISMLSSCTSKVRPMDNMCYVSMAGPTASPKNMRWIFHDDNI